MRATRQRIQVLKSSAFGKLQDRNRECLDAVEIGDRRRVEFETFERAEPAHELEVEPLIATQIQPLTVAQFSQPVGASALILGYFSRIDKPIESIAGLAMSRGPPLER